MSEKVKFKKIGANYREDEAEVIENRAREFGNVSQYVKGLIEKDLKSLEDKLNDKVIPEQHEKVLKVSNRDIEQKIKEYSLLQLLSIWLLNKL